MLDVNVITTTVAAKPAKVKHTMSVSERAKIKKLAEPKSAPKRRIVVCRFSSKMSNSAI